MIDCSDCDPRQVAQAHYRATGEAAGNAHLIARAFAASAWQAGWTAANRADYAAIVRCNVLADLAHERAETALLRLLKRKGRML